MKSLAALACCALSSIAVAAAPDASLYTAYYPTAGFMTMEFYVCGSLPGSDGCYGSGSLGPFGRVGAMVEGGARTSGNVVTHNIYVVDVAGGANKTDVLLYRYVLTNTVNPPYDTVTYKLAKKISLPLSGGINARCSMASNAGFLFIGTDKGTSALRVAKNGFAMESFGGGSNNPTVAAITSDANGFVIVTFGGNAAGPGGHIDFGPDGNLFASGGGTWFTSPTNQGISTVDLPIN